MHGIESMHDVQTLYIKTDLKSCSVFAMIFGIFAMISGIFAMISGIFAMISGIFAMLSGIFAMLSGIFAMIIARAEDVAMTAILPELSDVAIPTLEGGSFEAIRSHDL